jgi:hypothetical protein
MITFLLFRLWTAAVIACALAAAISGDSPGFSLVHSGQTRYAFPMLIGIIQ